MAWYWWVLIGLACWTLIPAIVIGPTLGKLLARRAEEQLTPVLPDHLGEALTLELQRIIAEHRKQRRREPTE
jgi:hypothetical protein